MPDLIRHPVFSWIPAFAGMTACAITYGACITKGMIDIKVRLAI
jgi:hypothetical protein